MAAAPSSNINSTTSPEAVRQRVTVVVTPNKLKASVRLLPLNPGEPPITVDEIKDILSKKEITFGIDEKAIRGLVEGGGSIEAVVAIGTEPTLGKDARLVYKFDNVHILSPKEDDDGRIDYKDINFILNASKGDVLVEKVPPTEGTPGTDVFGNPVVARPGTDVKLPIGSSTRVAEDGLKLLAAADGSITFANRRVSINEVHTMGGDVCIATGNITHNGTLIINGKIESGFQVAALGNIEIGKNVEDAKVISGGSIYIRGGFSGSHRGLLKAAGDIYCKYVDDQELISGNDIFIGGELYNSHVTAKNRVQVTGSKGRIVGGRITAGNEIRAVCLGSEAHTRTELQVGCDAELIKQYNKIISDIKALNDNEAKVKDGLYSFYRLELNRKLSPEQIQAMKRLEEFRKQLPQQQKELSEQKEALETEIQKNQLARIIAESRVYPGVILQFGIVYKEITEPMGPSYFQFSGGLITWSEYRPGKYEMGYEAPGQRRSNK